MLSEWTIRVGVAYMLNEVDDRNRIAAVCGWPGQPVLPRHEQRIERRWGPGFCGANRLIYKPRISLGRTFRRQVDAGLPSWVRFSVLKVVPDLAVPAVVGVKVAPK